MTRNNFLLIFILSALVLLIYASLGIGGSQVGFHEVRHWITGRQVDASAFYIINDLRLPRTMACLFVGAALGLCGLLLQTILENPLSEPYTLGVSGGASLGAILTLLTGLQPVWLAIPAGAILGCVLITIFLFLLSRSLFSQTNNLILVGIMLSLFCGSVVILFLSALDPNKLQYAIYWMMGQVGTPRDQWWPVLAFFFTAFFALTLALNEHFDRLLLGEDTAISLGTSVNTLRWLVIFGTTLLVAASVSIAGLIGFVGLLSPHVSHLLIKHSRHKVWITLSSLVGACFLLGTDVLSRYIGKGQEIPAGSIVAIVGVPIFLFMLLRSQRHASRS